MDIFLSYINGLTRYDLISQAIGFVGFSIYSISSFRRCRKQLFSVEAGGAGFVALHMIMVGSAMGAAINMIYMCVALLGRFHPETRITKNTMIFVMLALCFVVISFWSNSVSDIFILFGAGLGYLSRGLKNTIHLRAVSCLSIAAWMGFNILVLSWSGIIFGIISFTGHMRYLLAHYFPDPNHVSPSKKAF